jgi:hypothetical protein
VREGERGKDRQQRKSPYFLETRRQREMREVRMGERGKHTQTRDDKVRESK